MPWTDFGVNRSPPVARRPMCIEGRDGRLYANLVPVNDGILVIFCDGSKPKGERKIAEKVVDAPWHVVADIVTKLLWGNNNVCHNP